MSNANIEVEILSEGQGQPSPERSCVGQSKPSVIVQEGSVSTADENPGTTNIQSNTDYELKTHIIEPDPASQASRSTRSQMDSPLYSTRVEYGSSPSRVRYRVM